MRHLALFEYTNVQCIVNSTECGTTCRVNEWTTAQGIIKHTLYSYMLYMLQRLRLGWHACFSVTHDSRPRSYWMWNGKKIIACLKCKDRSLQRVRLITYGDVCRWTEDVQILIDLVPDFRQPVNDSNQIRRRRTTLICVHWSQSTSHVATEKTVNRLQLIGIMNGVEPVAGWWGCCGRFRFRLIVNRRLIHCCYYEWTVNSKQST